MSVPAQAGVVERAPGELGSGARARVAEARVAEVPGLAPGLRLAVSRLSRRLRAQHLAPAVSMNQLSALQVLARYGAMTVTELAGIELVRLPTVSRVVNALLAAGLISRRVELTDRRRASVQITEAGLALVAAEVSAKERWLCLRLAELTAPERELLAEAIRILDGLTAR